MERNLIAIFILSLFLFFIIVSTVYKQVTLQANLLGDKKFMKYFTQLIVTLWLSIIFLFIYCFLNFPVIDKACLFLFAK